MAYPFFTIGHSTRPAEEFVDLLERAQIACVVDVVYVAVGLAQNHAMQASKLWPIFFSGRVDQSLAVVTCIRVPISFRQKLCILGRNEGHEAAGQDRPRMFTADA